MDDSVGNKLREARARRKLTIADAEAATKIRGRYLLAIENDDWDQLPGDTYARAFIRTYGRFLGLDGERLAEEQRRHRGAVRPGEQLPRVDPRPRPVVRKRAARTGRASVPPRAVAAVATALVIAALLAIGLATGGDSSDTAPAPSGRGNKDGAAGHHRQQRKQAPAGHSLRIVAGGEVWVCLLDAREEPLVDGRILAPGEAAGPFRSGSFTLALGNGAVTMTVDGQQATLSEPSSPIGFAVSSSGKVRELPEGERPTCA